MVRHSITWLFVHGSWVWQGTAPPPQQAGPFAPSFCFQGMPATQPNRQELMNAGPHHAKLRVTAHVASPVCVAGSEIAGKIDVECRAEKGLGLGTIMVELMAFQELNSRDHAATSTFIHTRRLFQGPSLPPSNAVLPEDGSGRFPPHHYPARKGITTFFFRFPLPLTSPASVDFGSGLARIRYEVRASASVAWKGERRLVTDSQDIHVVESAMQEVESAGTVVGESGKIWVQGKVLGGAVVAGQTCCVELHVKNHSSRKTTGVNITFQRVLHLDNPPPQHANLVLSDTLVTAAFHSPEYCCPPGLEGVAKLVINVPRAARTVKGGSRESGESGSDKTIPALFDIRASINVRLCMGVGAKDLVLNLPVVICHPAALAPEPAQGLGPPNQDAVFRSSSPQSLYEPPRSPFMPPQSPVLPYHTGHSPFPPASPSLPYTQVYFPPASPQPPSILNYFPAPPMSPGFPMTPTLPMSPVPPMSPVLPSSPAPPMSPVPPAPCMSPVLSYTPPNQFYGQTPAPQNQMYAPQPPVSPTLPGTPRGPRAPQLPPSQSMPQFGSQHTRIDGLPVRSPGRSPARSLPPLPPRPTSAEPQVHQVGVDLPPANAPLSPSAGRIQAPSEVPDSVEGKGTRASRISEHLRMSSRTRSVSPTGRRFPGPRARPAPVEPPPRAKDVEREMLGPEPGHSPLVESPDRTVAADTGTGRPKAQDLGRVAAEETERASIRSAPQPSEPTRRNEPPASPRRKPVDRTMSPHTTPPKQQSAKRTLPDPPVSPRKELRNTPPSPSSPSTKPKEVSPPRPQPNATTGTPKPQGTPVLTAKPLEPMSTGLTALERRLTAKFESPGPTVASPLRKSAQVPEKPMPSPKEEPSKSIDWGEIARIGKLKSFALAKMKPALPAFAVPELPPASFVKPKPVVVRKPVPSIDEHEDQPVIPSTHSYPSSPRASKLPPVEIKPLVRYELTDGPVSPVREREQGTPTIGPEPRPSSRPPSQHTPSPIVEAKPLVRYELRDGPVPKTSSEPRTPGSSATIVQLPASPAHTPIQAPRRLPAATPVQTPSPARAPIASPPAQHSARSPVYDSPSPAFPAGAPVAAEPTRASPPEAVRTPPQPSPESRLPPSSSAVAPTVPKHVQRYQLSDRPVSKPPTRYQLTDPPVSVPSSTQPSAPNDVLMNHRANLRPISTSRPASPSKFEPRVAQAPEPQVQSTRPAPATSVPAPRSPTKEKFTPRTAPAPRIPSFPRPEDSSAAPEHKEVSVPAQPQARSPARRNPSPQRAPQKIASPPARPKANEPTVQERPRPVDPPRTQGESQAAQRAKYFESLAASKSSNPPPKPQPTQNTRNVLRPHQSNTTQATAPPPQVAPAHIGQAPRQVQSPMEASPAARVAPMGEVTRDTPTRTRSPPRRMSSPVFTANPVPPTIPTARSLIPITSSGFEVPVVLPGRDARERAEAALREAELFRLKREAISRVPMWMSSDYIPQVPPPTRAIRSSNNVGPPQSYWDIQQPTHEEPTVAELLARDQQPRAAYDPQLKHPRPRPVSSKPAAALLPTDSELLNKYDVRSARGGKGGQVTAITSLWQNGAHDATAPVESQPQPQAKRYTAPAGMEPLVTKFFSQTGESAPASPLAPGTGMMKSTSVPAMVHATQAVPVLSSTTSLARPVVGPGVRTRMTSLVPTIPESQSDDTLVRRTSQPTEGVAVGQARLKELIGKYQS